MIDIKTAVQKAGQYLTDMYAEEKIQKPLLEEVEYKPRESQWLVTFSFFIENNQPDDDTPNAYTQLSRTLAGSKYRHDFKVFALDANDGSLVSMKIRKNNE